MHRGGFALRIGGSLHRQAIHIYSQRCRDIQR